MPECCGGCPQARRTCRTGHAGAARSSTDTILYIHTVFHEDRGRHMGKGRHCRSSRAGEPAGAGIPEPFACGARTGHAEAVHRAERPAVAGRAPELDRVVRAEYVMLIGRRRRVAHDPGTCSIRRIALASGESRLCAPASVRVRGLSGVRERSASWARRLPCPPWENADQPSARFPALATPARRP